MKVKAWNLSGKRCENIVGNLIGSGVLSPFWPYLGPGVAEEVALVTAFPGIQTEQIAHDSVDSWRSLAGRSPFAHFFCNLRLGSEERGARVNVLA